MRRTFFLLAGVLAACVKADVYGPTCRFEWDAVNDSRVVGYRFYVNTTPTVTVPQGTTVLSCTDAQLEDGYNEVFVTAYAAHVESEPSNTLTFEYDDRPLSAPTVRMDPGS